MNRSVRRTVASYLGVIVIVVWALAPFYWMLVTAFRDKSHTFDTNPLPSHLTLDNFVEALATDKGNNFLRAIGNSLLIGAGTTAIALAVGVFTAYALARVDFRGKGFVTGIILAASMFPGIALVTPLFQLFTDLGWIGSYQALIIPNISFVLPLTVYTLSSFFRELPWKLEEAARVDGASRWQVLRHITVPLALPGIVVGTVLGFARALSEYGATLTFAGNVAGETRTIPLLIELGLSSNDMDQALGACILLLGIYVLVVGGVATTTLLRRKR